MLADAHASDSPGLPPGYTRYELMPDELLALGQHLEPVTHRENVRRSNSPPGINSRKTHCPEGHEYKERKGEPGTEWGFRYCPRCKNEQRRSPGPETGK